MNFLQSIVQEFILILTLILTLILKDILQKVNLYWKLVEIILLYWQIFPCFNKKGLSGPHNRKKLLFYGGEFVTCMPL